jgi:hypothetical protein
MESFDLECDGYGGIVLIEKDKVKSLSKEIGAVLNVVIDVEGRSDLVSDYPGENWQDVWAKELDNLRSICKDGLMFVGLLKDGEYCVDIDVGEEGISVDALVGSIKVFDSHLLVVEAGELIQSIICPQLPLDVASELSMGEGEYGIACNVVGDQVKIVMSKVSSFIVESNVIELSGRTL